MAADILQQIEFLLGSIGVILAFFFGIFLIFTRAHQPTANLFLAIYLLTFALRIGKSLFHNFYDIPAVTRTYILATLYCIGPSLWLYTLFLKNRLETIQSRSWIHYIPFAMLLGVCWAIPNDGTSVVFVWFYDGAILHMFVYVICAIWWILKHKEEATVGTSKAIESWLLFLLIANLILIILYFLISKVVIPFYIGLSMLFSLLVIISAFRALRLPALFVIPRAKYITSTIDTAQANLLADRLSQVMDEDRPYLDPELSLSKLSARLDCSTKELSQVINQIGGVNYAQYINQYRVTEVQRRLLSSDHQHLSIAAIAYDSGFNSISSFNSQFKKYSRMTAQQYRQLHLKDSQ